MKCQKRNLTEFAYRKYLGESDYDETTGEHTGEPVIRYGDPEPYEGNISAPSGFASQTLFGKDTRYTHVLLMDDPEADIRETGLIDWKGNTYEVTAVRPSLNVLAVALQKQTENNGKPYEPEGQTGETGGGNL